MLDVAKVVAEFRQRFGGTPRVFAAPGRINLIGEHTDYNDGFVLPFAIDKTTVVAAAPRRDRKLRVWSRDFAEEVEIDLATDGAPRGTWSDYVEGVARVLAARGMPIGGAELAIASDIPVGAGLSSSAALEVSVGFALASLAGVAIERTQLALAGQAAEHRWVGTKCGIMDQLVVAHGRRDHALLVDCRSLALRAVPLALGDYTIVVCDSGVTHALASSAYNQRRSECEAFGKSLRDATAAEAAARGDVIGKRARHVVSENARTTTAADALARGDLAALGRLMTESHASLRDDYEVSCPELDALVAVAVSQPYVLGARMTGGGFGGCTITLVERARVPELQAALAACKPARMFTTHAADGVHEVR